MEEKVNVSGIKGWLVLPAIGLILNLIRCVIAVAEQFFSLNNSAVTMNFGVFLIGRNLMLFDLVLLFFTLTALLVTIWMFFRKRKILPKIYIFWMWIMFFCLVASTVWKYNIFNTTGFDEFGPVTILAMAILWLIPAVIWTLYFLRSKRVKNTFLSEITRQDIVFCVTSVFLVMVLALTLFLIRKDVIARLFPQDREAIIKDMVKVISPEKFGPPPVYSYPLLELKLVESDPEKIRKFLTGEASSEYERKDDEGGNELLILKKEPLMVLDTYLRDAQLDLGGGEPVVRIALNKEGAKAFFKLTQDNIGNRIAIVCDGEVIAAPFVHEAIPSGELQISGRFDMESANKIIRPLRFVIKNRPKK